MRDEEQVFPAFDVARSVVVSLEFGGDRPGGAGVLDERYGQRCRNAAAADRSAASPGALLGKLLRHLDDCVRADLCIDHGGEDQSWRAVGPMCDGADCRRHVSLSGAEQPRLGEQPRARDRDWRRAGVDHDDERLGIIWRINKKLIRWASGVRGAWDSDSG